MDKYCIMFAGVPGSSKTPIANYLGEKLGLAVFCNDDIRAEVTAELGAFNQAEFIKRRDSRLRALLDAGRPFVADASIDRQWPWVKPKLLAAGYRYFIISLDLSREFLQGLHGHKGYDPEAMDRFLVDHQSFLQAYGSEVDLHITDPEFGSHLEKCLEAVKAWQS